MKHVRAASRMRCRVSVDAIDMRVSLRSITLLGVTVVSDYELARQYETINVYRHGGAAKLELNRPERMNAWNARLGFDLLDAVTSLGQDSDVRALLITGAGRAFSS